MKNESLGGKKIYSSILRKKWIKRKIKIKIKILFSFTFFNQTYITRNIKKIPFVSIFYHFLNNQTCNQETKSSPRRFSDYLCLTNLHKTPILLSSQTLNSLAYAFSNHSSQPQVPQIKSPTHQNSSLSSWLLRLFNLLQIWHTLTNHSIHFRH